MSCNCNRCNQPSCGCCNSFIPSTTSNINRRALFDALQAGNNILISQNNNNGKIIISAIVPNLIAGDNITILQSGNNYTISSTGGGGGGLIPQNGLSETNPGFIGLGGSLIQNVDILINDSYFNLAYDPDGNESYFYFDRFELNSQIVDPNTNSGGGLLNTGVASTLSFSNFNNSYGAGFQANDSGLFISFAYGTPSVVGVEFRTDGTGILFRDDIFQKGCLYLDDYSANFVDRSIIDKAYVDNTVNNSTSILILSVDPTIADISTNKYRVVKNTTSGEVRLWANDSGTLVSVLLT